MGRKKPSNSKEKWATNEQMVHREQIKMIQTNEETLNLSNEVHAN